MKGRYALIGLFSGIALVVALTGDAQAPTPIPSVWLQPTSPGTVQTGNFNISGNANAGFYFGNGANLVALNASAFTSGTMPDPRLSSNVALESVTNSFGQPQWLPDGTAAAPALAFSTDTNTGIFQPGTGQFGIATDGVQRFHIGPTGNVGIGTSNPLNKVVVEQGNLVVTNGPGLNRVLLQLSAGNGQVQTADTNGFQKVSMGTANAAPDFGGFVRVHDSAGAIQAFMNVTVAGLGQVVGDTKSFRVPNPNDIETDIWYASVEGPEAAAYLRGTARLKNGRAFVAFPEHFRSVAISEGMTVQLTPHSQDTYGLAILSKSVEGIEVGELQHGNGNFEFDWEVKAVRNGHEKWRVVRPWDEGLNDSERGEQWRARLKSMEKKGILK